MSDRYSKREKHTAHTTTIRPKGKAFSALRWLCILCHYRQTFLVNLLGHCFFGCKHRLFVFTTPGLYVGRVLYSKHISVRFG